MCDNPVDQVVPKGYTTKIVTMKCGNTSIYGETLLCGECREAISAGKMGHPDYCRHGVRYSGYDMDCAACEFGDDDE